MQQGTASSVLLLPNSISFCCYLCLRKMSPSTVETASAGAPAAPSEDYYRAKPTVVMPTASQVALPSFRDAYEAQAYWKHRLVLAFRIFAKFGFEDGVAGHITLRVSV